MANTPCCLTKFSLTMMYVLLYVGDRNLTRLKPLEGQWKALQYAHRAQDYDSATFCTILYFGLHNVLAALCNIGSQYGDK
jgi:hypothetical protein